MRHNENIKMLLAAGLLTLGAWDAGAQVVLPNSWNMGNADWNVNGNWLLESGGTFIPSNNENNEFTPEYALIDNAGTANISATIAEHPLAVVLGNTAGGSGHMVMTAGGLDIDGLDITTADLAYNGQLVIGNEGVGSFMMSGGTLNTTHGFIMSRSAGGSGTFTLSGGTVNSSGVGSIGAGGGEAATWNMSGGNFNQLTGDLNIADDGGGNATLNMTGGAIDVVVADFDLGGSGSANAVMNMSNNASVNVGNRMWVGLGAGTTSRLNVSGTASVTATQLIMNSAANAKITLSDQASVNSTANGIVIRSGVLRTEGHQVDIQTGSLVLAGTYNPVINSNGASVIHANGAVTLGGRADLEFDGVIPNIGDSFRIIDGASGVSGSFDTITGADFGKGVRFATATADGNIDVVVETALTLTYNTASGRTTLTDYVGGIGMKGYSLSSSNDSLNAAGWVGVGAAGQADWDVVASGAGSVAELMEVGSGSVRTFAAGEMHDLGAILAAIENGTAFGDNVNDGGLRLRYSKGNGEVADAILTIEGTENNLVLHVDSATGQITLQNHSTKTVDLKGYTIKSEAGDIDVAALTGLADAGNAGWDEANPTANSFSELVSPDIDGALTLAPGQMISLGEGLVDDAEQSLVLEFLLDDGSTNVLTGSVQYDSLIAELEGDWDLDGDVDNDDLAVVMSHLGDNATLADLFAVRNNFGSSVAGVVAVPEPASIALLLCGMAAATKRRRA